MKITIVAGARPNFVKVAPIIEALHRFKKQGYPIDWQLVHTGQHYDSQMSESFFHQLGIPKPDVNLEAGGGTQAEQTANVMIRFERHLLLNPTDLVLVVGDVNSTLACAVVAKKTNVKVAHVEAGIRSGDLTMPEEINRIITDSISDYFFTTTEIANSNLKAAGISEEKIFLVGNTMIDTLIKQRKNFRRPRFWQDLNLFPKKYFVLTLHRPSNVDNEKALETLVETIASEARRHPVIFPIHPRTASILKHHPLKLENVFFTEPLSYFEFNYLVEHAMAVVTDSGGITEETTVMHVPCITLRNTTERPETCTIGTNVLVGSDPNALKAAFERLFEGRWNSGGIPKLWDGHAAKRIVASLLRLFATRPQKKKQTLFQSAS